MTVSGSQILIVKHQTLPNIDLLRLLRPLPLNSRPGGKSFFAPRRVGSWMYAHWYGQWDGLGHPYGTVKILNVCRPWDGGTPHLAPQGERNFQPAGAPLRVRLQARLPARFHIRKNHCG